MSAYDEPSVPFIAVGDGSTTRWLPVQQRGGKGTVGPAVPIARTPKIAFSQPLVIASDGGTERRRNLDVSEIIFATWGDGMGEEEYAETETIASFQVSRCDTRFPRTLVCRPLATLLGSAITGLAGSGLRIIPTTYSGCRLLLHGLGTKLYAYNGSAWSAVQVGGVDITNITHVVRTLTGIYAAKTSGPVYRTTDGSTWEALAVAGMTLPQGLVGFDNKLFTLDYGTPNGVATAFAHSNITAAAASTTWASTAAFYFPQGAELFGKLLIWRYPPDSGKPTIWALTNRRLQYLDYYAATPTWKEWADFSHLMNGGQANLDAAVHPRTGNLYVIPGPRADYLVEYTGTTDDRLGPNMRGGLPVGRKVQPMVLQGNGRHLVMWGGTPADDLTSTGAVLAMTESRGWHHLYDHTTKTVLGGGMGTDYSTGEGRIWVAVLNSGNCEVYELVNPDRGDLPRHTTSRTYDSAACVHTSAWTDMGIENVNKRVVHVELDCEKANGQPGLDTGATVKVEILGYDGTTTNLGTVTASSTFPAVLPISGGLVGKKFKLQLTLTRGTATTATPIVKAAKLGFLRRPKRRYSYRAVVDLRDEAPAFKETGQFNGYSADVLREWLLGLVDNDNGASDDPLVSLAYGGIGPDGAAYESGPTYVSVPQCELVVVPLESPEYGTGIYQCTFNDVSAPTSG